MEVWQADSLICCACFCPSVQPLPEHCTAEQKDHVVCDKPWSKGKVNLPSAATHVHHIRLTTPSDTHMACLRLQCNASMPHACRPCTSHLAANDPYAALCLLVGQ